MLVIEIDTLIDSMEKRGETYEAQAIRDLCAELAAARGRAEKAERALERIDEIRKRIIKTQVVNWSRDIYPLVSVLNAALTVPAADAGQKCPTCGEPRHGTERGNLCSDGFHVADAGLVAGMEALREAGGKAWDRVPDVAAELGRDADAGRDGRDELDETAKERDLALARISELERQLAGRPTWEQCAEFRDAVLHGRDQLQEDYFDSDQTNAVLGLFDDIFGPIPEPKEPTDA